jgi:sugar-phosphatase
MEDKTGLRGCIFDVDGVLLDSIPAYRRAWAAWAMEHGVEERAIWAVAHGRRPVDIIRATAGRLSETAVLRRFETLIEIEYEHVNAVAGAREILERLPRSAWR